MHNDSLELTVRNSIKLYRRIKLLLTQIDEEVGVAEEKSLQEMEHALTELQEKASVIDQNLLLQLAAQQKINDTARSFLDDRAKLVQEILTQNSIIVAKALRVQSLICHEMNTLQTGHAALRGYKQQQYNQGRIVNNCS